MFPANRRINLALFTNYGFAQNWHKIKSPKQAKNEIIENCILSACDSVYREIFVSRRETVRLN